MRPAASSFLWLALFHDEAWQIVVGVVLLGLGIGLSFAAMANLIVEAVEPTETGIATGMNTIMRTLGGSPGGQIAASIVAAHVVAGTSFPAESGFTQAFAMSAVGLALAFGAALAIRACGSGCACRFRRRNRTARTKAGGSTTQSGRAGVHVLNGSCGPDGGRRRYMRLTPEPMYRA